MLTLPANFHWGYLNNFHSISHVTDHNFVCLNFISQMKNICGIDTYKYVYGWISDFAFSFIWMYLSNSNMSLFFLTSNQGCRELCFQWHIILFCTKNGCNVHNMHILYTIYMYSTQYACTVYNKHVLYTICMYCTQYVCTVCNMHVLYTMWMITHNMHVLYTICMYCFQYVCTVYSMSVLYTLFMYRRYCTRTY
jgi:hypothetical protein